MIDLHSHILPAFDDGAKDVKTSIAMIKKSSDQGVNTIVSTSHCYPYSSKDINMFLSKRTESFEVLKKELNTQKFEYPNILLGSEVHLTCDIAEMQAIHKLCIGDTDYMLLEMPFKPWTDRTVDMVYKLSLKGIKPIIAHMERNQHQKNEWLEALYSLDILVQINTETFTIRQTNKFLDKMFLDKMIHVVGSDMHNLSTRKPNMDLAFKAVKKRYGDACWNYLMNISSALLNGSEISYHSFKAFKKKTLFGI